MPKNARPGGFSAASIIPRMVISYVLLLLPWTACVLILVLWIASSWKARNEIRELHEQLKNLSETHQREENSVQSTEK
jgi:hypothetical protein